MGQSTFALAHVPEAEFGYCETDKWRERERERVAGREENRREGEREGKRQCRELALNPIALYGITTGFY